MGVSPFPPFISNQALTYIDLYTGNVLVSNEDGQYSDPSILATLPVPVQAEVKVRSGHHITKSFPRYIVEPVTFPMKPSGEQVFAKVIDFEQAFLESDQQKTPVRTPLVFRAPETLLDSRRDTRLDTWSLACTIFDLVVGQPPFDNFMPQKGSLLLEWIAAFGQVPSEWKEQSEVMVGDCKDEIDSGSLSTWLRETYFDGTRKAEFSEEDIERLGDLLTKMMRYKPEDRMSTRCILRHEWFAANPSSDRDRM